MLKRYILIMLVALSDTGCKLIDNVVPKVEEFSYELNAQKDTSFVVRGKGPKTQASFTIQGEISEQAKLIWDSMPLDTIKYSSPLPVATREIVINAGTVDTTNTQENYSGLLYVKYMPSNGSTSGILKVKVKM